MLFAFFSLMILSFSAFVLRLLSACTSRAVSTDVWNLFANACVSSTKAKTTSNTTTATWHQHLGLSAVHAFVANNHNNFKDKIKISTTMAGVLFISLLPICRTTTTEFRHQYLGLSALHLLVVPLEHGVELLQLGCLGCQHAAFQHLDQNKIVEYTAHNKR